MALIPYIKAEGSEGSGGGCALTLSENHPGVLTKPPGLLRSAVTPVLKSGPGRVVVTEVNQHARSDSGPDTKFPKYFCQQ